MVAGVAFTLDAAVRIRVEGLIAVSPVFTVAEPVGDISTRRHLPRETVRLTLRRLGRTDQAVG